MQHEVKIYGEVVHGQVGKKGFVSLVDVQDQLANAEGKNLKVRINSAGGDVDEGFAIYAELRRYAKENNAHIETFAEGRCASIATVFLLAGDKRTGTEFIDPFVHNAWVGAEGDSRQLKAASEYLEQCNDKLALHYSNHTNLTYQEARSLMDAETSITTDEAIGMRFLTAREEVLRPVALQRFNNQTKNKMTTKKKSILARLEEAIMGVKNKKVMDAEQVEVDFYELEEDDPIEIGALATVDGMPAGDYFKDTDGKGVMANGDIYVFDGETLTEIIKPEDAAAGEADALTDLEVANAKIQELEAANLELSTKLTTTAATNKELRGVLAKVRGLQSELEAEEPKQRPTNTKLPTTSAAAKAVKGLK